MENEFSFLDVRKPSVLVSLQIQLIIPLNICFILFSPFYHGLSSSYHMNSWVNFYTYLPISSRISCAPDSPLSQSIRLTSAKLANPK